MRIKPEVRVVGGEQYYIIVNREAVGVFTSIETAKAHIVANGKEETNYAIAKVIGRFELKVKPELVEVEL